MRALILTTAAVVLAFGLAPQTASAAWTYRFVTRFDPACNRNVTVTEKVWVPDVVVAPAPVVVVNPPPPPVVVAPAPAPVVVASPVVIDPVVIYRDRYHYYDRHYYEHYRR